MNSPSPATQPVVDVIIPAYNAGRWIAETLHSVVGQSDVTVRPVVVDDGSGDDTCEIATRFAPAVSLIRQAHRGIAAARNAGLAQGTAPYVAFLDADDVWDKQFLARQTQFLAAHPELVLSFTDHYQFDDGGPVVLPSFLGQNETFRSIPRTAAEPRGGYVFDRPIGDDLVDAMFIWTGALCVRRSAIAAVGEFDPSLPLSEDHDLWLRLCRDGKAGVIPEPLVGRRLRPSSTSNDVLVWLEGELRLAAKIDRSPAAYPARAQDLLARRGRVCLNAATEAERRGDSRRARGYYSFAWRLQPGWVPAVRYGLSFLPNVLRRTIQTAMGRLAGGGPGAGEGRA